MLAEARKLNGICYQEGNALDLKSDDWSYDLAMLIITLEFVADPRRALVEVVRIARHGLVLGVLNRWSLLALKHRCAKKSLWNSARFWSPWELKRLVREAAGRRLLEMRWRTTLLPIPYPKRAPLPGRA
jgi:SAM-dependent methyltransferase